MKCERKQAPLRLPMLMILLLAVWGCGLAGKVYAPADVPNVQVADRSQYVSDPEHLLDASTVQNVNAMMADIRQKSTAEGVVIVVPSIGDLDPTEFCEKIFTSWGIGKKDKDNGFIFLLAPDDRRAWIQTGYGLEGVLPDIDCAEIARENVVPSMKQNDINGAVTAAATALHARLTDPEVAEEIRSGEHDNFGGSINTLSGDVIWKFVRILVACAFLYSLVLFILDLFRSRGKRSAYERALMWRSHLPSLLWASLFSLGSGLIFALLAYLIYRYNRLRPVKCGCCGSKMKRLSESEDNTKLTPAQDMEEQLNTVDYDVWVCPECNAVDRFAYKENQNRYTRCPQCGTVAMALQQDHMIVAPTTRSEGVGEKVYECRFCHYRDPRRYRIPKKIDEAAALAAAAAAAAASRRRGGGGGFGGFGGGGFGGGFGGGSTGGGGGGASW